MIAGWSPASGQRFEGPGIFAFGGMAVVALVCAATMLDPLVGVGVVAALCGLIVVLNRPEWGVIVIVSLMSISYGAVPQRPGAAAGGRQVVGTYLSGGLGYLSINNLLGLVLVAILGFRVYQRSDWSFLRNRPFLLIGLITALWLFGSLLYPLDNQRLAMLGLTPSEMSDTRLLVTRLVLILLFVGFIRSPQQIRVLIGVVLALWLASAINGLVGGLRGTGFEALKGSGGAAYRAGGSWALVRAAYNPNRLALLSTLSAVLIWEYSQSLWTRRWRLLMGAVIVMLIVTVIMTASRSGVAGLAVAMLMMLSRHRESARGAARGLIILIVSLMITTQLISDDAWERLSNIPGLRSRSADTAQIKGSHSIARREHAFSVAFSIAAADPLFGVGMGNWAASRFEVDPARSVSGPHNAFLLTLGEGGIVVLSAYLLLFVSTIRQLRRYERQPLLMQQLRVEGVEWVVSATRICLTTLLVFSIFADLWNTVVFYLLFSLAAVMVNLAESRRAQIAWSRAAPRGAEA